MPRKDLEQIRERGTLASALLSHPGWTTLVMPFFTEERTAAMNDLLEKENESARATVNVVDGLQRRLVNLASAGKQAKKRLGGT